MAAKVEMLIQVCINGRPVWRKAKTMRAELSAMLTDKEYDRVLDSAVGELNAQHKVYREREAKKKETAGAK